MPQPQSKTQDEWVEIKFFVPLAWKRKLEEIARMRGKRTLSEMLRDVIEELLREVERE